MVMSGRSVYLLILFLGRLSHSKPVKTTTVLEIAEGETKVCGGTDIEPVTYGSGVIRSTCAK